MGNSLNIQSSQQQKNQLLYEPSDHYYQFLEQLRDRNGNIFLATEIDISDSRISQNLRTKLQERHKYKQFLYPITRYYFEQNKSICSLQQTYFLTCIKPQTNLKRLIEQRKKLKLSFNPDEINLILNNISQGLKTLNNLGEAFPPLKLSSIVMSNNVYLLDPLLFMNLSYNSVEFRSPEELNTRQDRNCQLELNKRLFSLGIIGLQVCFPHICIQQELYVYYHSSSGTTAEIRRQKLFQLINNIMDNHLKAKISILANMDTRKRLEIFGFIQKERINLKNINFISQTISQESACTISSRPLSRQIPTSYPVKQTKIVGKGPVLRQNINKTNILESPLIEKALDICQIDTSKLQTSKQTPKISINFINNLHHNSHFDNVKCPASKDKKIKYKSNQLEQQIIKNQPKQQIKNNSIQQTPKKQVKKKQFSTIKQVTENDECISNRTSKITDDQDFNLNGIYKGNYDNGKKNGLGTFYFQQGSIYAGEWLNDQMNGYGKLYYPSGKLAYEGQWKNNEFNGYGKVYNCTPKQFNLPINYKNFNQLGEEWIAYEGSLVQDRKEGEGCLKFSNGQMYKGSFVDDKIQGNGVYYTMNKQVVRGIWRQSILQAIL